MVELEHIHIAFGRRILLDDASARVDKGLLCALIGVNGAGKSTLLRRIAGLSKDYEGKITLGGEDIRHLSAGELARKVALVTTGRVRVGNLSCREVVALGRAPYTNWIGRLAPADVAKVDEAIYLTNTESLADRMISTLSDGEAQRVMVARAIAQDTPLILLDEPTSFLDLPSRYRLVDMLDRLTVETGKTIIFSTHELDIAARFTARTLIINSPDLISVESGELVTGGYIKDIFGIKL